MPCKSTITPSEIVDPSEVPGAYVEDLVRLRYNHENSFYFQSIDSQWHALSIEAIRRLEHGLSAHFAAVRWKNKLFGVYDV
ncbi:hypothetical protein TWF506_003258 [Arthrobotrys conoides]|uniref:Uncharacterized protein n=1 Tax=Arthrobotrys conoides TaxID=74498 RepID=A0AAN8RUH9_9PEZI